MLAVPSPNDGQTQEKQTPARFQTPDLASKGMWMADRVCEKWPNIQKRYALSWFGGATAQNEYYFVHTKNVVALAQQFKEGFSHLPTVRVWFVLLQNPEDTDQITEGADLFESIVRWAKDIGADRIIDLNKFSDVPDPIIKKVLGDRVETEKSLTFAFSAPSKK